MRMLCKVALTLGVAVLLAVPALAQPPGGRGGFGTGFGGPGMLLRNEGVQKELKLSEDQVKKVTEALQKNQEKYRDDFAALRDATPEEQREKFPPLMKKVNEDNEKAVAGILDADQTKRLKQIELQVQGVQAFSNEDVQKKLNLTDAQKDDIKLIAEELQKEMRSMRQGFGGGGAPDPEAIQKMQKKMQELNKESMEKVSAVLKEDQKKTWKEMNGAHFELKFEPQRRRQDR